MNALSEIDKKIGKDILLMVHANVLPTKALISKIKKMQHGEFMSVKEEGAVAYKFSAQEVMGLHKIKMLRAVEVDEDIKVLHYPWQIFQLNDWAIRQDYALITAKRKSRPVSKTNTVINPAQVFIEPGAKVEHCILNASNGPIYIGKNAEVMEGSMLRGPVAVCEGSLVKMGSKIYGAPLSGLIVLQVAK